MDLNSTIAAVQEDTVEDIDQAKLHLHLLVETVTEQNR